MDVLRRIESSIKEAKTFHVPELTALNQRLKKFESVCLSGQWITTEVSNIFHVKHTNGGSHIFYLIFLHYPSTKQTQSMASRIRGCPPIRLATLGECKLFYLDRFSINHLELGILQNSLSLINFPIINFGIE